MQAKLIPLINNSDLSTLVKDKTNSPNALPGQIYTLAMNVQLKHSGARMVDDVY